jgi:fatty-acyl-CoA synthase
MLGARVVGNNKYTSPIDLLGMVIDQKCTFSAAVPTVWQSVRGALEAEPEKFVGKFKLRQIVCGGSSPPNEMMRWYLDTWKTEFVQIWGMTETSPCGTVGRQVMRYADTLLSTEEQFKNVTKQGMPMPTMEIKLVDPDDFSKPVAQDGVSQGELLARGPHTNTSYYNRPETDKSFPGGWLATGDVASIDKFGIMEIRDRSKDVIKSGGEWISSQDLEKFIAGHPSINYCTVVAQAHPKWDERPIAVITLNKGKTVTLAEVRDMCTNQGGYARYQLPDDVVVWDELPMTGTGKISKKDVRLRLTTEKYILPSLRPKAKL